MTRHPGDSARIADLRAQLDRRPGDLRARKHLGDALRDAGRVDDAVQQYQAVVGGYAAQGLLFRAIAACKTILDLVPDHEDTTRILAELYARRASGKESAELTKPMSAALMSEEGDPISLPDGEVELVPPPLPEDAITDPDSSEDDVVDATALAAALTPLPEGAVRIERPPSVPLFSGLSTASFQQLVNKLSAWEAEPGALIIGEGEESDSVFVVVRGKVQVERNNVVLATLGPDSFFGEMALLSKRPRVANVVAVEKTELLEMSRAILESLVENDPGVAAALDQFCRSRLLENLARTSPLLQELPLAAVKSTLSQFTSKRAKKGERLLAEGEPAKGLFVVLAGELDVMHTSAIGPVRIKQLGPGDVFGEMSLLSGETAAASVVAANDCTVLALDKTAFADFARANPALETKLRALAEKRREHIAQFLPDETSSAVLV